MPRPIRCAAGRDPSNSCRLVVQEVREMVAPVLKSFQAQVSESHDLLFFCRVTSDSAPSPSGRGQAAAD